MSDPASVSPLDPGTARAPSLLGLPLGKERRHVEEGDVDLGPELGLSLPGICPQAGHFTACTSVSTQRGEWYHLRHRHRVVLRLG